MGIHHHSTAVVLGGIAVQVTAVDDHGTAHHTGSSVIGRRHMDTAAVSAHGFVVADFAIDGDLILLGAVAPDEADAAAGSVRRIAVHATVRAHGQGAGIDKGNSAAAVCAAPVCVHVAAGEIQVDGTVGIDAAAVVVRRIAGDGHVRNRNLRIEIRAVGVHGDAAAVFGAAVPDRAAVEDGITGIIAEDTAAIVCGAAVPDRAAVHGEAAVVLHVHAAAVAVGGKVLDRAAVERELAVRRNTYAARVADAGTVNGAATGRIGESQLAIDHNEVRGVGSRRCRDLVIVQVDGDLYLNRDDQGLGIVPVQSDDIIGVRLRKAADRLQHHSGGLDRHLFDELGVNLPLQGIVLGIETRHHGRDFFLAVALGPQLFLPRLDGGFVQLSCFRIRQADKRGETLRIEKTRAALRSGLDILGVELSGACCRQAVLAEGALFIGDVRLDVHDIDPIVIFHIQDADLDAPAELLRIIFHAAGENGHVIGEEDFLCAHIHTGAGYCQFHGIRQGDLHNLELRVLRQHAAHLDQLLRVGDGTLHQLHRRGLRLCFGCLNRFRLIKIDDDKRREGVGFKDQRSGFNVEGRIGHLFRTSVRQMEEFRSDHTGDRVGRYGDADGIRTAQDSRGIAVDKTDVNCEDGRCSGIGVCVCVCIRALRIGLFAARFVQRAEDDGSGCFLIIIFQMQLGRLGQDAFRNFRKDFHTVQLGGEGSDLHRLLCRVLFRFLRRLLGRKLGHGQR